MMLLGELHQDIAMVLLLDWLNGGLTLVCSAENATCCIRS